ncbi:MAG: hypothetical protein AB8B55_04285 [Mariniblastus sp.]
MSTVNRLIMVCLAIAITSSFSFCCLAQEGSETKSAAAKDSDQTSSDQASLEKSDSSQKSEVTAEEKALHEKLSKYLSGTKWIGKFTMDGKDETRTEQYEILTAEKGEIGDYWNLVARIKYGGNDATLPLPPIEIKFAGKTPVITVDEAFFPGFGKFDARVLIRKGKYSGTWKHSGGVGGHLFGTIERMDDEEVKKKVDAVKAKE